MYSMYHLQCRGSNSSATGKHVWVVCLTIHRILHKTLVSYGGIRIRIEKKADQRWSAYFDSISTRFMSIHP
jgi:hypothetical protein